MSLEKILNEIKLIKPFVTEDVDSGPAETLNARRGRKFQAMEQLKRLKREYRLSLLDTAVFIITTGNEKEEFQRIATENCGCFSADPEEFYKDLANRVHPTLYLGKEGISNIFDVLGRHLEDKMIELDIIEYNQLFFRQEFNKKIETTQDFVEMIKKTINTQIGAEIIGIQAVTSLVDKALEREHSFNITPIVLSTSDERLIGDMTKDLQKLTKRIFVVSAGEDVSEVVKTIEDSMIVKELTKENVDKVFKSIKKMIKK